MHCLFSVCFFSFSFLHQSVTHPQPAAAATATLDFVFLRARDWRELEWTMGFLVFVR
jgi:hypothetical protein